MNIGAWLKTHKPEAALGAGGIAVTVLLALRARSKNAAGAASGGGVPASSVLPVSTADTTQSDAFNGIEEQVVGLQSALLGLSGAGAGASSSSPGSSFIPLTAAQAHSYQLNDPNISSYYESAPGIFTPVSIDSFNPWSGPTLGTAYLLAPPGYAPPTGAPAPSKGVVAS